MRDYNDGHPAVPAGRLEKLQESTVRIVIQRAGRASQDHFGFWGKRPCDRNSLLFASGEAGREVIFLSEMSDSLDHIINIQRVLADL
jgi:hypothetical protein